MTLADHTYELIDLGTELDDAQRRGDWGAAMVYVRRINEHLAGIATLLVARGVRDGMTQRRMADNLGVPPRTLEGARREFAR
jgi:hypothetical protein